MSQIDLERFISDLKSNEALLGELTEISAGLASVVQFAKDKGYDISIGEAKTYISEQANQELSDSQLDAIAGGKGGGGDVSVSTDVAVAAQAAEAVQAATTAEAAAEVVAVAVVVLT